MKMIQPILMVLFSVCSFSTLAHSGHDHHSQFSQLIHLLWLAPAMIAVGLLYSYILKKSYKMDDTQTKSSQKTK